MQKKIVELVIKCAQEINERLDGKIELDKGEQAPLFGLNGALDSLGLVSFIVEVEQVLEDEMDVSVQLVSEKAMSQKSSPFLTIGTLAAFIEQLIKEGE